MVEVNKRMNLLQANFSSVLMVAPGLGLFLLSGCALHHYDAQTGTEHLWGFGHFRMKAPPQTGARPVVVGTQMLGLNLQTGRDDYGVGLGWDSHSRVTMPANGTLLMEWPTNASPLPREIANYVADEAAAPAEKPTAERLDVADGGHYNNLGVESLVNRGCGYIIVVDAEHDSENKTRGRSNQSYHGLKTLMDRHHIKQPDIDREALDRVNEAVHVISGNAKVPDLLYVKLKSLAAFDKEATKQRYNKPGFLENLFGRGKFSFNPQFSTAKLDYSFAEHRNLTELGVFMVKENAPTFRQFVNRAQ